MLISRNHPGTRVLISDPHMAQGFHRYLLPYLTEQDGSIPDYGYTVLGFKGHSRDTGLLAAVIVLP
jgi:hypothetical protein